MIPSFHETVAPFVKNMQIVQDDMFDFLTTEIKRLFDDKSISPLIHRDEHRLVFDVVYPLPKFKTESRLFNNIVTLLRIAFINNGWKSDDLFLKIARDNDNNSNVLLQVKYNYFFSQYISDEELKGT